MQFVFYLAWCALVAILANKKGRRWYLYFLLSLVTSPLISLIIVLCMSDLTKQPQNNAAYEDGQTINLDESQYTIQDAEPESRTYTEVQNGDGTQVIYEANDIYATQPAPEMNQQPAARICPACDSVVKEGAKFCENCGYQLDEA